jgi:PTH1 family peptidyl-tRNA hydrolase
LPQTSIIVGLGNPGPRFADTRHNVGWRVVDLLSQRMQIPLNERRPKAVLGTGYHSGRRVVLAKPRTFMNNSGEAVEYLLARFGGGGPGLLIIYDEMALLPGRIRLRAAGSDAGHNGIRSIIQAVGGVDFPRLRIGIGGPPAGVDARDYVLGKFSDGESEAIADAVERSVTAVQCAVEETIDAAMNRFNQDPAKQDPAKQDPAKQDPAKQDPAKQDPAKQDPAKQDPAKQDPAKQDPAKQDPARQEEPSPPSQDRDSQQGHRK